MAAPDGPLSWTVRLYNLKRFNGLEDIAWDSNESAVDRQNWTPQEYVSLFWDDKFLMEMCKYTKMKFHKETGNVLNICLNDMKTYLGATLLMSCLGYPRVRMYWQKTTRVPAIANAITRNKYFQIRNHLKVLDDAQVTDEQKQKDKLWKVRPIMDRVRKSCLTLPRSKNLAVDEQMIPFTDVCAVKQYVPGKPNPEGLKNFVLAAPSGLVLDFEVYQRKNTLFSSERAKRFGVGGSAVMRLIETIFYFYLLIDDLRKRDIACTGTIMKSRVPNAVHLTNDKIMSKMERGSFDMSVRQDDEICIVKWYDKKAVLLCSSKLGVEPLDRCKRWSKKDRRYIEVPRPVIIKEYNANMGGIDLIDRMISYYRIRTRTKKWTVKTTLHFFDLSVVNAWILMREDQKI
ncbi:piggyBac transposable element-derived protein 3-like [Stegodyphus dumicola]|uniref:piggyBac transposable element-derived protein 3-like n=1 Tax=Stegodyphus dumicola TaxID=202533 RepID=UPI0015AF8E12|nr:piggyBac transposable element-derived protein 3-like [Stegodyphus dumicola]